MAKFKYAGDSEAPKTTTVYGVEFTLGETSDVNDENAAKKLRGMPGFEEVKSGAKSGSAAKSGSKSDGKSGAKSGDEGKKDEEKPE